MTPRIKNIDDQNLAEIANVAKELVEWCHKKKENIEDTIAIGKAMSRISFVKPSTKAEMTYLLAKSNFEFELFEECNQILEDDKIIENDFENFSDDLKLRYLKLRGNVNYILGEYDNAQKYLEQAIDLAQKQNSTNRGSILLTMSRVKAELNRHSAMDWATNAFDEMDDNARALLNLVYIYIRNDEPQKAMVFLKNVGQDLEDQVLEALRLTFWSYCNLQSGQIEQSLDYTRKVVGILDGMKRDKLDEDILLAYYVSGMKNV